MGDVHEGGTGEGNAHDGDVREGDVHEVVSGSVAMRARLQRPRGRCIQGLRSKGDGTKVI